jgi:hypothetical protein
LSNGIEVSFKDCIFIFTSNDGTRDLEAHGKGIGFGLEDKKAMTREIVMKAIKRRIRPEVINRFSGIIIFNSLGVEEMKKIRHDILMPASEREEFFAYEQLLISQEEMKKAQEQAENAKKALEDAKKKARELEIVI